MYLNDEKQFIGKLQDAGQRKLSIADEMNADNEEYILHIALSYKHSRDSSKRGTISIETAKETFNIIQVIQKLEPEIEGVRVWIDQNMYRYPNRSLSNENWTKYLVPYTQLLVVCPLYAQSAISTLSKSPFVWLEMNMAFECQGLIFKQMKSCSLLEALGIPANANLDEHNPYNVAIIVGKVSRWRPSTTRANEFLSFWAPGMFHHDQNKYSTDILLTAKTIRENIQHNSEDLNRIASKSKPDLKSGSNGNGDFTGQDKTKYSGDKNAEQVKIPENDVKHFAFDAYIKRGVWMHGLFESQLQKQPLSEPGHEKSTNTKRKDTVLMQTIGTVQVSELQDSIGVNAHVFEIFGNNTDIASDGAHYNQTATLSTSLPKCNQSKKLFPNPKNESRCRTDFNGSFSLWDARFGRGICSQLSPCGRLLEHFIEKLQRIGTVAMTFSRKAGEKTECVEHYRQQLKRLISLSKGKQTLRYECEMEFVKTLQNQTSSPASTDSTGLHFVDMDLEGHQRVAEEDAQRHYRIIRPRLLHHT